MTARRAGREQADASGLTVCSMQWTLAHHGASSPALCLGLPSPERCGRSLSVKRCFAMLGVTLPQLSLLAGSGVGRGWRLPEGPPRSLGLTPCAPCWAPQLRPQFPSRGGPVFCPGPGRALSHSGAPADPPHALEGALRQPAGCPAHGLLCPRMAGSPPGDPLLGSPTWTPPEVWSPGAVEKRALEGPCP